MILKFLTDLLACSTVSLIMIIIIVILLLIIIIDINITKLGRLKAVYGLFSQARFRMDFLLS